MQEESKTPNRLPPKLRRRSVSQQVESISRATPMQPKRSYSVGEGTRIEENDPFLDVNENQISDIESLLEAEQESGVVSNIKPEMEWSEKLNNALSITLIVLEQVITSITFLLPESLINAFTKLSRFIFSHFKTNDKKYDDFVSKSTASLIEDDVLGKVERLRKQQNFTQICEQHGFKEESHLVHTPDGFKLTLHRLKPENNGFKSNGKAVYFQHGLLMTSDVWVVMLDKDDNLPFRLCELGYDVFLGNNRGNKYSNKHEKYNSDRTEYWDFSIDEFAMYDIPSSIDYILKLKQIPSLTYIGFSQGCSQILSSISINNDLNEKIERLILIAPATTPKGLKNRLLNSIINFDPTLIYMLFGRKILMKSVMFWRKITYPPMFVKLIDLPNDLLFNWKSRNINIMQKLVSYYHLYSTTSVKCVVHWFQIIKSKKFQMYQEKDYFQPFQYPTNMTINVRKLLIIYGMSDSLVDIDILVGQLPDFKHMLFTQVKEGAVVGRKHLVDNLEIDVEDVEIEDSSLSELRVFGIADHEHLDLLWGERQKSNVIDNVIEFLE